jgi:hypothetical protein
MERVLAKARAVLAHPGLKLFWKPTSHVDWCPIIQITSFSALEPHVFRLVTFLGHDTISLIAWLKLFNDAGYDARSNGATTFAYGEA